jgi:hypothetical protein
MKNRERLRKHYMKELVALIFSISVISACGAAKSSLESVQSGGTAQMDAAAADSGTLRVSTINPRYFTDSSGKPIYLTGSHTWTGLIDRGAGDPPAPFDFERYLDFLQNSNHNFIRLWSRHVTRYNSYGIDVLYSEPLPWVRSGPGNALDGKPRFNLNQFNEQYFSRLRARTMAARQRGIYVSIMLFGGHVEISEWAGNPFNSQNNINGVDGDFNGDGKGDTQVMPLAAEVDTIQKAYVNKVIDTVADLDNVLFEISNESESNSVDWQSQLISYIKDYQSGRIDGIIRKKHPVGMTAFRNTDNDNLLEASADWISPGAVNADDAAGEAYITDPPAADGQRVSILDSDHLFFTLILNNPTAARHWVWTSFLRGHNPILMENIFQDTTGRVVPETTANVGYVVARAAMGQTRRYATRVNLAAMTPRADLSSTGYVLASPGSEYLVYQPQSGPFAVDLIAGSYAYEWFDAVSGTPVANGVATFKQGRSSFAPPFAGNAILYLKSYQPKSIL